MSDKASDEASGVSLDESRAERVNLAFLGLGSNIQPQRNLPAAVKELAEFGVIERVSRVWQSPPVGYLEQPDFLNAAALLRTAHTLESLRQVVIPAIERKLKRRRDPSNKNAPRTIDVDVVLFNEEVIHDGDFQLPAPDLLTRRFVAQPIAELAPDFHHPITGKTLRAIAESLSDKPLQLRDDLNLRG